MSDRIAVMLDGKIVQLGDPEIVYDRPATAFVAAFIGQQNFFEGTVDGSGNLVGQEWVIQPGRAAGTFSNGAPGLGAVRPESIVVTATDTGSPVNRVAGTLVGVSHLGDVLQYVVKTAGGHEIVSRRQRANVERLPVGSAVWCRWETDEAHLFEPQGEIGVESDAELMGLAG